MKKKIKDLTVEKLSITDENISSSVTWNSTYDSLFFPFEIEVEVDD